MLTEKVVQQFSNSRYYNVRYNVIFLGYACFLLSSVSETPYEDVNKISISNCDAPTCILKQGTTITIEIKIVPDKTIQTLTNDVHALLLNVPLPFIGVDGTDACNNIYNSDGSKAGCPLNQGVEYIYKNSFDILPFYPKVALVVRYALREGNNEIICFEAPSKITK